MTGCSRLETHLGVASDLLLPYGCKVLEREVVGFQSLHHLLDPGARKHGDLQGGRGSSTPSTGESHVRTANGKKLGPISFATTFTRVDHNHANSE